MEEANMHRSATPTGLGENAAIALIPAPNASDLPSDVAAEIAPVSSQIGFVPNIARLLAISPRHFVAWWRYFDELMRGPSNVTKVQRELIAVVVSAEGRSPY